MVAGITESQNCRASAEWLQLFFASHRGNAGLWVPAPSNTRQLFVDGNLGAGEIGGHL